MSMQAGAAAGAARATIGSTAGWLGAGTLAAVADLNEQCLDLLRREAAAGGGAPLLVALRPWWQALVDPAVRARAAACPYLMVDAGFANAWAWTAGAAHSVHDGERRRAVPFFSVPGAARLLQQSMVFAWHLARSEQPAARLLLGMSAECAGLLAAGTLRQVADLAERHPEWLQPRWPGRVAAWESLLCAAVRDDAEALERARMRGLQLLAADAAGATGAAVA